MHCCDQLDLEPGNTKLALFGAAGRLGTTVVKYLLYKDAPKELVLIDLPDKINLLIDQAKELLASDLLGQSTVSVHTFTARTRRCRTSTARSSRAARACLTERRRSQTRAVLDRRLASARGKRRSGTRLSRSYALY
jgi:hypothetical protein